MTLPRDQPSSRLGSQAKLVFGTAVAMGLQLGFLQSYLLGSRSAVFVSVATSLVFGAVSLGLWQTVFPRIRMRSRVAQVSLQGGIALVCMTATSFLVLNGTLFLTAGKSMFSPYTGGDVSVLIPATSIAWGPYIYFAFPILPTALLVVVGFNQSWWQIFLLEKREHEARELAALAQLDALRAQINPHFLFNSLNSIVQLISTDPERAEECVQRLAEIFRYLLRSENRSFVTLADELDIADAYLDIERARFGDKLSVDVFVDEGARHRFVPTLIRQPLIENAVRHGVSQKIGGGRVSIEAGLEGEDLRVIVRDTGVGMVGEVSADSSGGVGLRNVHNRLVQLFGDEYAPQIASEPGSGTAVTLRVPLVFSESPSSSVVH